MSGTNEGFNHSKSAKKDDLFDESEDGSAHEEVKNNSAE